MRVGLVREDAALPDLDKQAELLLARGDCGEVVEVDNGGLGPRRLEQFLRSLQAEDVVCVVSLNVLSRSLGRLIRFLKSLAEARISVVVVGREEDEIPIRPGEEVLSLLQLLAACDPHHQSSEEVRSVWHGRAFLRAEDFTAHQRDHVHTLYEGGMSLRAIGMIFRTSPGEIWKLLAEGRRPGKKPPGEQAS